MSIDTSHSTTVVGDHTPYFFKSLFVGDTDYGDPKLYVTIRVTDGCTPEKVVSPLTYTVTD